MGASAGSLYTARRAREAVQSSFNFRGGLCSRLESRRPITAPRYWTSPMHVKLLHPQFSMFIQNSIRCRQIWYQSQLPSHLYSSSPVSSSRNFPSSCAGPSTNTRSPLLQMMFLHQHNFAAPLLTCRQFYFEARFIAFACIDWCIDVEALCRANYSRREVGGTSDNSWSCNKHIYLEGPIFSTTLPADANVPA
jgi:hypothetical protein